MNKEFYQNGIPIFWGSRRKERDLFFFTRQVDTPEKKKKKPPLFDFYRYPLYRSFSVSSREENQDHGPIKEKKRLSHQREANNNLSQGNKKESTTLIVGRKPTQGEGNLQKGRKGHWSEKKKGAFDKKEIKNNLSLSNRKESSVDPNLFVDGKPTQGREIKGGNVQKKWQGNWRKKKKGGLDNKEAKNNFSQGHKKESSLDSTAVVDRKPTHGREIKEGKLQKERKGNWCQEKKGGLDTREIKNNLFQGNRKKLNLSGFEEAISKAVIGERSAHIHDREIQGKNVKKKKESTDNSNVVGVEKTAQKKQIKGGNVRKKKNDFRSREKKAVLDVKEETINKTRAGFRFSTLAKNNRMGIKKKYGHRVKVFFGRARGSLKGLFLKFWKRGFRKQRFQQRFFFLTRKGGLKKKLYRNIKIGKQLFTVGKKRVVTSRHLLRAKRIEYRKYKKRKRRPRNRIIFKMPPGGKKGLIALKGSYNNIILTLTDTDGNTKAWVSAGTAGFKNGQKSSHVAAEAAVERLVDKSIEIGYQFVRVKMKGMGGGKLKAIRRLCKSRLKLIGISDHFLIPHNGCRRARKPRN